MFIESLINQFWVGSVCGSLLEYGGDGRCSFYTDSVNYVNYWSFLKVFNFVAASGVRL